MSPGSGICLCLQRDAARQDYDDKFSGAVNARGNGRKGGKHGHSLAVREDGRFGSKLPAILLLYGHSSNDSIISATKQPLRPKGTAATGRRAKIPGLSRR